MDKKQVDIRKVRRKVKYLLVDKGLDRKGSQLELARQIGIPHHSLNMALTGYRNTPRSLEILQKIQEHLGT